MSAQKIEKMVHVDPLVHLGDVWLVGHGCRATDSIHRRMLHLLAIFEMLSIDNSHQEHAGRSLLEYIVRRCNRLSSSSFHFEVKHLLISWKTILEPVSPSDTTENQQIRLSKKKLITSKAATQSNINWEQLHKDQLWIAHRHELTRLLFLIREKSFNLIGEFEQTTYVHQLCTTALFNLYTALKTGWT